MTWYRKLNKNEEELAVWSEYYPGHHEIVIEFNLDELKEQLKLVDLNKVNRE